MLDLYCLVALCGLSLVLGEFKQDAFAIGGWVDPQVPINELDYRYAEMRAANFTIMLGFDGGAVGSYENTPERVLAQIAACDRQGLRCVPTHCDNDICVGLGANISSNWGAQLQDEPTEDTFPQLAARLAHTRSLNPDAVGYINLLPGFIWSNISDYTKYVANFRTLVKPSVLSFDFYPDFTLPPDTTLNYPATVSSHISLSKGGYRTTLAIFRDQAHQAGIPFWSYVNAMPFGYLFYPKEAEIRWAAWTAVAYGAKGVLYFCYWNPGTNGGAMISLKGPGNGTFLPTALYGKSSRINSHILAYAPYLLDATSQYVCFYNTTGSFDAGFAPPRSPYKGSCAVQGFESTGWPSTDAAWYTCFFLLFTAYYILP